MKIDIRTNKAMTNITDPHNKPCKITRYAIKCMFM